MNINELKVLLESIQEQMAVVEDDHEEAVTAGNWEKVEILNDTFAALDNREYEVEQLIVAARAPKSKASKATMDLVHANID